MTSSSIQATPAWPTSAIVIGASGGIGRALAERLARTESCEVLPFARNSAQFATAGIETERIDLEDEDSIEAAAARAADRMPDLVIVTAGILHSPDGLMPEKSWRHIDAAALARYFAINTIGPALVAKHFLPLLPKDRRAVFAALSARVGSIGDNRLGGWHGYRASKAALNMLIRNFAIELARTRKHAICVGLHPGTVATDLSKPFRSGVDPEKLLCADDSARHLMRVLQKLEPEQSGRVFAWDGEEVPA